MSTLKTNNIENIAGTRTVDITNVVATDISNTFSTPQRTTIDASGDNSVDFDVQNNFSFTATATDITVTNQTVGQGGTLIIALADLITGWGTEFDWGYSEVPTDLTGTETFGYFISGASGANSIKIGRV